MSWDEGFARRYEEWSAHMTADIAFYVDLARETDGPLVELAIGNGRVAIPVAQATGRRGDRHRLVARDARAGPGPRGRRPAWSSTCARATCATSALDEPAGLIYCPFRALLHLPTWADRRRTFERVAASLRPGGRFAWNAFAFDHRIAARPGRRAPGRRRSRTRSGTPWATTGSTSRSTTAATSSLWWATKNEWLGLVDVAGLTVEALYGGFAGEPFDDDSREYVFVARR